MCNWHVQLTNPKTNHWWHYQPAWVELRRASSHRCVLMFENSRESLVWSGRKRYAFEYYKESVSNQKSLKSFNLPFPLQKQKKGRHFQVVLHSTCVCSGCCLCKSVMQEVHFNQVNVQILKLDRHGGLGIQNVMHSESGYRSGTDSVLGRRVWFW